MLCCGYHGTQQRQYLWYLSFHYYGSVVSLSCIKRQIIIIILVGISRSHTLFSSMLLHQLHGILGVSSHGISVGSLNTVRLFALLRFSSDLLTYSLSVFCDNCGGQNKNNTVLRMAVFLVEMGYFKEVEVVFLIVRHTKNACDRLFNMLKCVYTGRKMCGLSPNFCPFSTSPNNVK